MWSQQQSSSHSNWSEVHWNQELFFLSLFFFFWFYVWLRQLETQKTITLHTKSLISSCHASANVSNTSLNIGGPKQSNNHLITHLNFFSLYETPVTDTMSNVNEVLMMGTHKSLQHFIWGIYGTDSVETWTCVQDLVKSMRHEHMVLLCRNRMLNHHCKTGFHSQQRHSDLTNSYGLSQASHPEAAEHNVLWCAILSPPPSDVHGSQSLQSTGIYPPAQLLCVRLIPSIWFTGVCEPDRQTEEEEKASLTRRQEHERGCPAKSSKQIAWMRQCWWRQKWHWRLQ